MPTAVEAGDQRWPSVSVVVPTRDRPLLVRRAVAAVLDQDYPGPIECIVVVDGDEPPLPALNGGRHRVRAMRNGRRAGAAGARNAGALAAEGELVAFCDDDDEWLPGKLRRQVDALESHPDAVLVSSGIELRFRGRIVRRVPEEERITFRRLLRSRVAELHTSSFLIRREDVVGRLGPMDEEIPFSQGEDYEWLLRAARIADVRVVREPLVRVHWHEGSWFMGRWERLPPALTYLLERVPEFASEPRGLARIYGQMAFAHAAMHSRAQALDWSRRALRANRAEPRAYVALLVAAGLPPALVLRTLNLMGRGV